MATKTSHNQIFVSFDGGRKKTILQLLAVSLLFLRRQQFCCPKSSSAIFSAINFVEKKNVWSA